MKKFLTLLTLLVAVVTGAWATETTVGITTTTVTKSKDGGERTVSGATNLAVTHQLNSGTTGALAEYTTGDKAMYYGSSTAVYSAGAYKWNVNTSSTDIVTANNYVGYSVVVADGYQYSLTKLKFGIAGSAGFTYKLVITDGTSTLYDGTETTVSNYNKSNATGYTQDINLSLNNGVQNLTGTFYVRVYLKFNSTGKYLCFPEFTITGNLEAAAVKDYTVTAASNNDSWGSASAAAATLDEGETTIVTATANDGYKFVSWAVEGGASLSSTTANPTTLKMGTANATVTATFRALETYAITYDGGASGTGSVAAGEKTEDEAFVLSTSTFTRDGYSQTGWSLTDGGEKDYELGGSYTTNAAQTFYPFWAPASTLSFNANGGSGSMDAVVGGGTITLTANAFTKSGYTFIGWNTEADGSGISYADGASYSLSANSTLYAQWAENFFEFTPKSVTENENVGTTAIISTTVGGQMQNTQTDNNEGRLVYTPNGLLFAGSSNAKLTVNLNDYMEEGTIICATFWNNDNKSDRGVDILNAAGADQGDWYFTSTSEGTTKSFTFTATTTNGFAGTKSFSLKRKGNASLQSLTVANAQPGATTTSTGWCTYSSHKALDLSTLTDGFTAYVAKEVNGDNNVIMSSTNAIVPANTGLMIKGTASTKFTIDATSEEATFSGTNLLVALPEGGTVTAANNTSEWNYVFGYESATNYGFYKINAEAATLGLGKAYLHTTTALATAGSARLGIIFDDETTGITSTAMQPSTEQYFNLAGQRVAQPTKGLYIVNGRKVVVK